MPHVRVVCLEPLDGYEETRTLIVWAHTCAAQRGRQEDTIFVNVGNHIGSVFPCGCEVIVPKAQWEAWVAQTSLERAVRKVRQKRRVCGSRVR